MTGVNYGHCCRLSLECGNMSASCIFVVFIKTSKPFTSFHELHFNVILFHELHFNVILFHELHFNVILFHELHFNVIL